MAPDERERIFDKALARHLRAGSPSHASANSSARGSGPAGECADAETLAAYHERSLLPEEMNFWKEHIVGCANCQTILAHLEATDEIPLQPGQEETVLAREESALEAAASSQTRTASPAASSRKSRRVLLLRGARWQWLAPAGALAAGLLVWIALHENQSLPLPALPANENKVAQNREPVPLPPVSTATPKPSLSRTPSAAPVSPQSAVKGYVVSNGRAASEPTKQSRVLSDEALARSTKSPGDKEVSERKDGARDASVDVLTAGKADLDDKNLSETLRQREEGRSQAEKLQAQVAQTHNAQTQNAQTQNAQTQNQYNYAPNKVAGPAPLNQAESLKKAKRLSAAAPAPAAPPPPAPTVAGGVGGAVSSYNSSASLEAASVISNPRLISPPGSNLIWRAGRSGVIEFSKDGGSSWSRQTSGVLTDLLAGSAPSEKVCWMVGRAGTILLTTDGGAHWRVIPSPLAEDLGGIRASDALHATVWNARSTKSFATSDGGLIWTLVPSP
jgi:hypothetical protein